MCTLPPNGKIAEYRPGREDLAERRESGSLSMAEIADAAAKNALFSKDDLLKAKASL